MTFLEALEIVEDRMEGILYPPQPAGLYHPIHYILSLKGKKIRPVLTLLGCNLFRDNISDAINPALAWEIFHNFTLMHDDVMDKAEIRRGLPTVHKKWNENTAILSGDAMLILAYQYIARTPQEKLKDIVDLFSTTSMKICEGQQYDMEFEGRLDVVESEYLEMIYLKTAVLIGACLKSGAIIGGANERDANNLEKFGINLGLAFQIRDDLLDVYGDPAVFGKNTGGDILSNKKTYFLINALSQLENKSPLLDWLDAINYNPKEKIEAVTEIYNRLNLKKQAEEVINVYYEKSIQSLLSVQVEDTRKKILFEFAKGLMERNN